MSDAPTATDPVVLVDPVEEPPKEDPKDPTAELIAKVEAAGVEDFASRLELSKLSEAEAKDAAALLLAAVQQLPGLREAALQLHLLEIDRAREANQVANAPGIQRR